MAEMNNSVYGNPSSLTIQNEKNIKTGEYSECIYIYIYIYIYISSFYIIFNVHHRNFANYGIDFVTSHFNEVVHSSAVTRAYNIRNLREYFYQIYLE